VRSAGERSPALTSRAARSALRQESPTRKENTLRSRIEGGDKGRGTVVFESEDAARAVAGQITQDPGQAVTLDSVDVEVVESA
jgi:hypothetical protein